MQVERKLAVSVEDGGQRRMSVGYLGCGATIWALEGVRRRARSFCERAGVEREGRGVVKSRGAVGLA